MTIYSNIARPFLRERFAYPTVIDRDFFVHTFSFPVLTNHAIKEISKYAPILEVGAGSGYWAYEFKRRGIDYIASDKSSPKRNGYFPNIYWIKPKVLTARRAIRKYPNRTLLISWPCHMNPWAYNALKEYNGDIFIFCGESEGGCTANDNFYAYLEKYFEQKDSISIPQWYGIHDYIWIYKRL